jgi:hypothetical protein
MLVPHPRPTSLSSSGRNKLQTNILIRVSKADIVACFFLMMIMMWVRVGELTY